VNLNLDNVNLRPFVPADVEVLFFWKNDPVTRANSVNTEEVPWVDHFKWFQGVMADPKGKILRIAEIDGIPVGLVRTGLRDDGTVEVHYTVSPNFRRQGVGTRMVKMFVGIHLEVSQIVLPIKKGNIGSEKIAVSLGLSRIDASAEVMEEGQPPLYVWAQAPGNA
jgi:RimJ/RimL family protein N-acetyltransferase